MGYVYIMAAHAWQENRAPWGGFAYRRGLLRCSFYQTGQCEGLEVWDGQQVQTPALFLYVNNPPSITKPAGFREPPAKNRKAMKTIIVVKESAEKGKTSAIGCVARRFPMSRVKYFDYHSGREVPEAKWPVVLCRGVYESANGEKFVGFSSEGDIRPMVDKALAAITDNGATDVDVIVTACRTKFGTVDTINDFAKEHGYNIIWTSLYHGVTTKNIQTPDFSNGTNLNEIFAENIVSLINKLLS